MARARDYPDFTQVGKYCPHLSDRIVTVKTFQVDVVITAEDPRTEDLDGIKLGDDFSFSFSTAPVQVSSTSPGNSEVYVTPYDPITMWFNTFMVKSSVASAFSITPGVAGTVAWGTQYNDDVKNALTFWPATNLKVNTKYTVTIGTQAQDLHGTHLKEHYSFTFITRPE